MKPDETSWRQQTPRLPRLLLPPPWSALPGDRARIVSWWKRRCSDLGRGRGGGAARPSAPWFLL